MSNKLIEDIKLEEGFKGLVYKDHLGFDTIGYGCKLPLDEDEAELLLRHRLGKCLSAVNSTFHDLDFDDHDTVVVVFDCLYKMCYQLGLGGLLKFKNMIGALYEKDFIKASDEALDSLWAKQTPKRAEKIARRFKDLAK